MQHAGAWEGVSPPAEVHPVCKGVCVCERERVCACRCQPDFYLPICDAQKRMQKCRFGGGGAGGGEEEMK